MLITFDDRSLFLLQQCLFAKWSKLVNHPNAERDTTAERLPMLMRDLTCNKMNNVTGNTPQNQTEMYFG